MITRDEQAKLRAGRITGSIAQRIMTSSRTAWNTIARDLREPKPFYSLDDTPNMPESLAWGQQHERQAIAHFWELHPEYDVHHPTFLHWHDPTQLLHVRHYGVSPDRMLSNTGFDTYVAGLEAKCPYDPAVHAANIRIRGVPGWCYWQIYHGMYVTGLREWWFVSFDPRPEHPEARYCECRVLADQAVLDKLARTLDDFLHGYTTGEPFRPKAAGAKDFAEWF